MQNGMSDSGRWPTDIVEAREAAMLARLHDAGPALAPLRAAVTDARHPWWKVFAAIVVGGGLLSWLAVRQFGAPGWTVAALAAAGALWAERRAARFGPALETAREALDARLVTDVLQVRETDPAPDALALFAEMGVFRGSWDNAALRTFRFVGENADGRDLLHAHLTREERYTDSQGRRRTRTVTVFRGLLFSLPAPFAQGPAVTTLATGRRPKPHGRFARPGTPARIKTASLEFNQHHKIHTTDPVIGHAVLDPDRVMRLINMEHDLSDEVRWGRADYTLLFTQGRVWAAVNATPAPALLLFPEGDALEKRLRDAHAPLSIPAVMAHHLRLPPNTDTP